jgi:hypothetical protein
MRRMEGELKQVSGSVVNVFSAGIVEQSMGARNRADRVVVPARQATQPCRIGSLESILGLLKSLKIRAQKTAREGYSG